jgi:hypothetical protein
MLLSAAQCRLMEVAVAALREGSALRSLRHMPEIQAPAGVWLRIARAYTAFTSPLVPCSGDIAAFEAAAAAQFTARQSGVHALMLGVTPGVALMRWPIGSRITAVDYSRDVIDALWPGDVPGLRRALCSSWFEIPLPDQSCDIVIGDGSLNACRFPGEAARLTQCAHKLLVDGGVLALRVYVRPQRQETIDQLMDALFSARGLSVDSFKMRLWLAMQRSVEEGVAVREAASLLHECGIGPEAMSGRLGWSEAVIEPFAAWPVSSAVYSFPSIEELRAVTDECFDTVSINYPGYDLGHCCPTLVMRKRAS